MICAGAAAMSVLNRKTPSEDIKYFIHAVALVVRQLQLRVNIHSKVLFFQLSSLHL